MMKKGGYGIVVQEVMRNKELSPEAKAIYAYLSSVTGTDDRCFPSIDTMLRDMAMSRNRLTKHMNQLIEFGVVEKTRERTQTGFGRNIYKITHRVNKKNVEYIYQALQNETLRSEELENQELENYTTTNNNTTNNNTTNNNRESNGFAPPTVKEVAAYCEENGFKTDPEVFVSYYNSKGWMIGKNQMTDWKQAVITWEKREEGSSQPKPVPTKFHNFKQHQYEGGELDKFFVNQ